MVGWTGRGLYDLAKKDGTSKLRNSLGPAAPLRPLGLGSGTWRFKDSIRRLQGIRREQPS